MFTDGSILVDSQGEEYRTFNTKDGIAVKLATDLNYNICVISGEIMKVLEKDLRD